MRALHFAVATVVGFLLYLFVVVYIGGLLAAVPIPTTYFRLFGREHAAVGHALLGITLHGLPTVLLVAAGILAAERVWLRRGSRALLPYFLGMLAFVLAWELLLQPSCLPSPESQGICTEATSFQNFFAIPWWALPVVASPWLGLSLAAWLLKRNNRSVARGVA